MKIAKQIIELLEDGGYLSKTLGDEAGKEWRKDRNDYVEAIITEKLSSILGEVQDLYQCAKDALEAAESALERLSDED